MKLPPGWTYTPTVPEKHCPACGHTEPAKSGTLRNDKGREWPLIGNNVSPAKEREMVQVIIDANDPAKPKEGSNER